MDFFWAYIWPLIVIVAQSVMLLVILLVAIAYVLLADLAFWIALIWAVTSGLRAH